VIVSVTPASLVARLAPEANHLNRLETLYRQLEVPDAPVDEGAVRYALSSLVKKGLAQEQDGQFTADGGLLAVAGRTLLVSGWFEFDVADGTQAGEISAGCSLVVQGGPRALLLMEHAAGNIRLTGVSGDLLVQMVGPIFGVDAEEATAPQSPESPPSEEFDDLEPSAGPPAGDPAPEQEPQAPLPAIEPIPEPEPLPQMPAPPPNAKPPTVTIPHSPAPPPSPPASTGPKFCKKCGTERQQGSKFCVKCGAPMG
jgi:hypothetical protein